MAISPEDFDRQSEQSEGQLLPSGARINEFGEFVRGKEAPKKDHQPASKEDPDKKDSKDLPVHLL